MLDSLSALVAQVQHSGIQVTSAATEIASTAMQQEATVTEQAFTTNEIKATVTEISATAKELVNTMNEVADVAMQTSESAGEGQQSLQRMESIMHHMMEATASINAKLAVLNEKPATSIPWSPPLPRWPTRPICCHSTRRSKPRRPESTA